MVKVKMIDFFKGLQFRDITLFSVYIWLCFSYYRRAYVQSWDIAVFASSN